MTTSFVDNTIDLPWRNFLSPEFARAYVSLHFSFLWMTLCWPGIRNESVPKIIVNNTLNLLLKTAISILVISNRNSFRVLSDKIATVYFIYILALEMASLGNQHCASCIGTCSFPIGDATGPILKVTRRVAARI